ncbi:peptidylprolyl isomerase [Sulfurospirillum arcachonense]|uniref:peptidylprolyl isomerase n=1 Tax=Sulfurospirillum arcachonense TaxID=57666 RepID=UPI00046AB4D0
MAIASARHILVQTEKLCKKLKKEIITKEITFEKAAKKFSKCPSGKKGGDLGKFKNGQMVKEFDKVIFNEALHVVHGPVKTQFGFHLIEITSRGK